MCGVLLVAAVGVLWVCVPSKPPEPVYEGRPLSYWLTFPGWSRLSVYRFPEPYGPKVATEISGDTNAVPYLINALRKGRWFGQTYYHNSLQRLPPAIQRFLPPADAASNLKVRINAAALLGLVGPNAKAAIPALIRALREDASPLVRGRAATTLGILGSGDDAVLSALRGAQKDKDSLVSLLAQGSLTDIRLKTAENARRRAELEAAARADAQAKAEINAVWKLGLHEMAKALRENPSSDIRHEAAEALGELGKENEDAVAALTKALGDRGLLVRKAATNALLTIDPAAAAKAGVESTSR